MQSEEFDKKIIEAAEHHHPVYNEKAWAEMNKLLDKHLPEKKERRRPFIFWWLLPVLLGGAALLITQMRKGNKQITETVNKKGSENIPATTTPTSSGVSEETGDKSNVTQPTTTAPGNELPASDKGANIDKKGVNGPAVTPGNKINVPVTAGIKDTKGKPDIFTSSEKKGNPNFVSGNGVVSKKKKKSAAPAPVQKDIANEKVDDNTEPVNSLTIPEAIAVKPKKETDQQSTPVVQPVHITDKASNKTDSAVTDKAIATKPDEIKVPVKTDTVSRISETETAVKKVAAKKKKTSSFFISFSAGPDLSFVSSGKAGTTKIVTGAGIGYTYKERLTLRTGFYSGRKVYSAGADAYNPPASFTQFYPYLEKVDANCKVYEIPLSLLYNFGKGASKNWFLSAGLSSFLMNEETYNYHYKYTPTGNTYTNKWTVRNENFHYFSVLTFSGGYQRNFGKRLSLMAEPYIKIPLGGVGYGKVKLNSGGVLFTAGIKLF
ncbi:MAG: hypothetical protein ABL876_03395 [Chitinophagaceae bacterium]